MKITNIKKKKMFIIDPCENLKCQKYAKKKIYSGITTFQCENLKCQKYVKKRSLFWHHHFSKLGDFFLPQKKGTSSLSCLIGNYVGNI